ncbi:hypothetical protein G9C98_001811 [Cotesia typhae]|uniref:C2H2-type domain-containing protein n=1 Tax=Cotesia typhae TaxID=2053667 RepID=A0A8J5R7T6_9HYME|nr:hypothetical protein G9C98_001811 [Cotesia typhae]
MEVSGDLTLHWEEDVGNVIHEEVICDLEDNLTDQDGEVIGACEEVCVEETVQTIIDSNSSAHNLPSDTEILMVPQSNDIESIYIMPQEDQGHDYLNIQVTEEVITDNWDRSGPDDGVEIPETKVSHDNLLEYDDMEIPIEQDPYTNTRPYPCDFCSRRFRKKANLMNHMTTHQNDRPHSCNLCGARYVRKSDLMNHLKTHAYAPPREGSDDDLNDEDSLALEDDDDIMKGRRKKIQSSVPRKRKNNATVIAKHNMSPDVLTKLDKFGRKSYDYVEEDLHFVDDITTRGANSKASSSRWTESLIVTDSQPPRWPISDPTKPYVCQYCGMGFAREKALASHSRFHAGDSPYECSNCSDMFWDPNALREHMRVKHGLPSSDIDYDINETYTNDERFGQFYCDVCAVAFDRIDLLKRHRKIHVKQETEEVEEESNQHHVCNVCGEWFEEALALLAHAELHASRSPSRRCLLCGAKCRDDAEVAEHLRQNHADDAPPNTCTLCGKTCKDKRSLLKHSWVHNVDKTFGCTKCGKSFHSKARLRRHMVSHRNKMVACDECGEEFPDGRALVSHRHSHNKELGGRTFPCRECGKTFGSRSSQQIHLRIHTGERPYGCRFCWKAFADGGTLRKHERIHTGEKPYGCAICPRAFNQRVVLREHVRAHHSGPDPKYHGSLTPFFCKVCNNLFGTSEEIVLHIVQHCDDNTALRRQPQVGPRKYKRRRKLKSHESPLPALTSQSNENFNTLEFGSESDDNTKRKLGRKNKQNRSSVEEGYQNVLKSFESSLQNINSIVNNSKTLSSAKTRLTKKKLKKDEKKVGETQLQGQPGRPRMIHTQKTRVPVELGTEGAKKGQKTKTMVTRTPKVIPTEHKLGIFPGGERNRPRTKNVSYHSDGKVQVTLATFPKPKDSSDDITPPVQSISPENIKMEMLAAPNNITINYESNNGNLENVNSKQESLSKKKVVVKGRPGRRSVKQVTIKQEPQDIEIHEEISSKNNEEYAPSTIYNEPEIDGSNMEVAFEANVIADEEEHEAILPDLDGVNHDENLTNNVKLSVKVESTTQHQHIMSNVSEDVPETIIPDTIEYTCEMCAAVFSSRNELLNHVPIHI